MHTIRDRFHGCLLGGAVGDALGAPIEFLSRAEILDHYGPQGITRYAPAYGAPGRITDDTQMSLFTGEGLLLGWEAGCETGSACLVAATRAAYQRWLLTQDETPDEQPDRPEAAAGWLLKERTLHARRGPGTTCLAETRSSRRRAGPALNDRKGCGGVMRVAPVGLFLWRPDQAGALAPAFQLAAELAGITHGHPTGRLAAGVLAVLVLAVLDGATLPEALAAARALLVREPGHEETLQTLEQAEMLARSSVPGPVAVEALGEGWVAEEALAISVYCALTAESFEAGIMLAVNHDGDSDSTGAITGNLLGALHGVGAIPDDWLAPLELRELITDMADRLYDYWRRTP